MAVSAALALLFPDTSRAQSFGVLRIRLGVVAGEQFRPAIQRLEPFRLYLAQKLETPVEVQVFRNGQELVDAAATRRIDYGIYSASTYAATWRACGCIEPLVAPRSVDGTAGIRSIVIVRADSGFDRPADLKGKVLGAAGPRSIAGRLVPFAELSNEGFDPAKLFQRIETLSGPEAAVSALLDRRVDAALAWSTMQGDPVEGYDRGTLHTLVQRHQLDMGDIKVIWRSDLIPNGPHAVRSDLPLDLKQRLRNLLVDLVEDSGLVYEAVEPVFGGGFSPVGHSAYLPLLRLVTPAGQDPAQPPVPRAQAPLPQVSAPQGTRPQTPVTVRPVP